jgi:hypothetical protein
MYFESDNQKNFNQAFIVYLIMILLCLTQIIS